MAANGEVKIGDVVERLANDLKLGENERSQLLPSGRQTVFSNRVHWAKTYLAQAGLVNNTKRAHFVITERGAAILAKKPQQIDKEYLAQFPEFVEFLDRKNVADEAVLHKQLPATQLSIHETPDEIARSAARELSRPFVNNLSTAFSQRHRHSSSK